MKLLYYFKKVINNKEKVREYIVSLFTSTKYIKKQYGIKKKNDQIKVGFIVHIPEMWDKEAPVFEAMIKDKRFSPFLIVVPRFDIITFSIGDYGDELSFFKNKYENKYILKAYDSNEKVWMNIEKYNFDYVFFQRHYDVALIDQYHASEIIKYTRTCYIPYAFHALEAGFEFYKKAFFRNLYFYFCCSEEHLRTQKTNKYTKALYLGYPALSIKQLNENKNSTINVLWTPRWASDERCGGSTFLENIYNIFKLKEISSNIKLILRPHPFAFDNAIKNGTMSEQEVIDYKRTIELNDCKLDRNAFIEDTFSETDILITDFSSVVVEYFITGKPIIYCTNANVHFSETYKKIIECSYVAHKWEEIEHYVKQIISGVDPLREKRQTVANEIRLKNINATNRILDCLYQEYEDNE